MTIYQYRCDSCGTIETQQRGDMVRCPNCGLTAKRKWQVNKGAPAMDGHFNYAAGQYVRNETELRDAFKKTSEEQTKLTGNQVTIEPVDYRDREACGITDSDVERLKQEKAEAK